MHVTNKQEKAQDKILLQVKQSILSFLLLVWFNLQPLFICLLLQESFNLLVTCKVKHFELY